MNWWLYLTLPLLIPGMIMDYNFASTKKSTSKKIRNISNFLGTALCSGIRQKQFQNRRQARWETFFCLCIATLAFQDAKNQLNSLHIHTLIAQWVEMIFWMKISIFSCLGSQLPDHLKYFDLKAPLKMLEGFKWNGVYSRIQILSPVVHCDNRTIHPPLGLWAILPVHIYNPITVMGFSTMFTFQLDNTKK